MSRVPKSNFTEEDFQNWLEHPATEALIALLEDQIEGSKEIAAEGGCLGEDGFMGIGQRYFAQINRVTICENILASLEYQVLFPPEGGEEGPEVSKEFH